MITKYSLIPEDGSAWNVCSPIPMPSDATIVVVSIRRGRVGLWVETRSPDAEVKERYFEVYKSNSKFIEPSDQGSLVRIGECYGENGYLHIYERVRFAEPVEQLMLDIEEVINDRQR